MLNTRLFVGNIEWTVTQAELWDFFSESGVVIRAEIVIDRTTNRSRGFGFVEMQDREATLKAIDNMNGKIVKGRRLNVSEARPRVDKGFRRETKQNFGEGVE